MKKFLESLRLSTAEDLLRIGAIKLNVKDPVILATDWRSSISCDILKVLSYPDERECLFNAITGIVEKKYEDADMIAAVAIDAIAIGMLVAEEMGLPFVFVRPDITGYGQGNLIEGDVETGQKVVVIDNLISTGTNSIDALNVLHDAGCDVLGMVATFTYGFEKSIKAFEEANCELTTVTNYETLLTVAMEKKIIDKDELEKLKNLIKNS